APAPSCRPPRPRPSTWPPPPPPPASPAAPRAPGATAPPAARLPPPARVPPSPAPRAGSGSGRAAPVRCAAPRVAPRAPGAHPRPRGRREGRPHLLPRGGGGAGGVEQLAVPLAPPERLVLVLSVDAQQMLRQLAQKGERAERAVDVRPRPTAATDHATHEKL